jgi:hypothetical protein
MDVAPQYETFSYQRRVPEQTLLYRVLAENLETFLDRARTEEHELPRYVEKELREYLTCGVLGHGFVRLKCEDCGKERAVAFSCKGRGFCPSCTGRRMSDTAARLVDDVFPDDVPVRQWVLSLPINIRYRLAYDGALLSKVLSVFLRVVQGWYRRQMKVSDRASARFGSASFCQRFGSSLNLNPHFHTLALDGVYLDIDGEPKFHTAPPLTDDDVRSIVETTAHRVIRLLEKRGVLDEDTLDPLVDESPVLAGMTAASVQGMVATGDRAGFRVRRVLADPAEAVRTGELCYASRGFSLHAATRIPAGDKDGLERLCRYVARPPLAAGRLTALSEDELLFKLKTPWSDGTTSLIFSPLELIEKISALVPPPRINLIRYHGVLAAAAKHREKIVPAKPPGEDDNKPDTSKSYRLTFAALLSRVFQIEIDTCADCGGKMKIVAALTDPDSVRRYLEGTGQSARIPEIASARAPPQLELDYDY